MEQGSFRRLLCLGYRFDLANAMCVTCRFWLDDIPMVR
jgi:hypothetical protein